ncbi:site-specific integrase [Catalinimonas sp. 4WD22]|uniref:site-specific integrase n=1 Tax=Catalinimonas locisalis TaxID=3133978 RepID=UPI003101B3AB
MRGRKVKEPVRLRERTMKDGNISLYLDIYHDGKRSYEFLKLYVLSKPKTAIEKQQNKEVLQLANSIKSQKILELQNNKFGFINRGKGKTEVLPYFLKLTEERKESNYQNWLSTYKHLKNYASDNLTFNDVTSEWVKGFRDYLLNSPIGRGGAKLSKNSAYAYYGKFKAFLNQSQLDGLIQENPADKVESIKQPETKREFLTLDELQKLVHTECKVPELKKAFLFSALTGLRWSDIEKLTWSEIRKDREKHYIVFEQKKTAAQEVLPITQQARDILGAAGENDSKVFEHLKYSAWHNLRLKEWFMRAGILKEITFHSARHSFATLMLSQGVDIYTVSKLLGHRELKTTQIYAKVMDKQKEEAVNKMPNLNFGEDEV